VQEHWLRHPEVNKVSTVENLAKAKVVAKPFKTRALNIVDETAIHVIGGSTAVILIFVVRWLFERLLGHDAKFFDYIPIRWVFDAADVLILVRMIGRIWKGFNHD
jgi:hypothetical protein